MKRRLRLARPVALLAGVLAMPVAITAAEEARQRAACAAAGEQILAVNAVRSAVYQEQFAHYSRRTNRCYVEMRVQTVAADERADRIGRFLYDGETRELLAVAQIEGGKKSGRVFDLNHRTTTFANDGWDDASDYIYRLTAGDDGS
ncbi:MAG: hypothetical protein J2P53_04480 [Bradyrhizobiaceae bacterium]|nr:hypothetical protein [Bradyrhizobiaceae bacterium]